MFCDWLKNSRMFEFLLHQLSGILTLRFFFKFVQKYIEQMSPPENKKCGPGKVFGIKPPSNLPTFEQEGP